MPIRQISVRATVPEGMTPVALGTEGPDSAPVKPAIDHQTVLFEPVFEIKSGETMTFRVRIFAGKAAPQLHFSAELSAPALPQPIVKGVDTEVVAKPTT
jgi:hypothetical protein